MKDIDMLIGIISTVIFYIMTPSIPYEMAPHMKFAVFFSQCIISALGGMIMAGISNWMTRDERP